MNKMQVFKRILLEKLKPKPNKTLIQHLQQMVDYFKKNKEIEKDYGHNCEEELKVVDVPSGYQENYCTPCNEKHNYFTCRNCDDIVEVADTFCTKYCYKEYWV